MGKVNEHNEVVIEQLRRDLVRAALDRVGYVDDVNALVIRNSANAFVYNNKARELELRRQLALDTENTIARHLKLLRRYPEEAKNFNAEIEEEVGK